MIDITGLREDKRPQSSTIVHALLDRLEAAEKERDELRTKIEQMEKQEPAGIAGPMPGTSGFTVACFSADEVPMGTKLYALPGAKGETK